MITRLFGFMVVAGSLATVFFFEGNSSATGFMRIFHWPAMVLTGIGPLGMVLVCYDTTVLGRTIDYLFTSPETRQKFHDREAHILHRLGRDFYSEGPSAFEKAQPRGVSEMASKIIERLSIRMPNQDILEFLNQERDKCVIRLVQALNVVGLGVKLSPSIGMLGTILGMVSLLSTLQDTSKIGSSMSLALLTTFYGLFFSIILWTPIQQRLERILDVELEGFDQAIRWLELLEKRKPSDYFADLAGIQPPEKPTKAA